MGDKHSDMVNILVRQLKFYWMWMDHILFAWMLAVARFMSHPGWLTWESISFCSLITWWNSLTLASTFNIAIILPSHENLHHHNLLCCDLSHENLWHHEFFRITISTLEWPPLYHDLPCDNLQHCGLYIGTTSSPLRSYRISFNLWHCDLNLTDAVSSLCVGSSAQNPSMTDNHLFSYSSSSSSDIDILLLPLSLSTILNRLENKTLAWLKISNLCS